MRTPAEVLRSDRNAFYRYFYGIGVPLDTHTALKAVKILHEHRFDELSLVADTFLRKRARTVMTER